MIDVNPGDKQWNASVKDIVKEVCSLDRLEALQLYLPEVALLNDLQNASSSINLSKMRFRFTVGRHLKRIISRLPLEAAVKFDVPKRCLKFVKGEDVPKIRKVLQHVIALFLDCHSTATSLFEFGIEYMKNLKFCVLRECDEIQTIVDANNGDKVPLRSLEYLNLYYMKNLRSIWKGPFGWGSLSPLTALELCTCPQLTTIFTLDLSFNLCNLEEFVVEDCPEIESIVVTHDPTTTQPMLWKGYLFPKLKKISLHYMPKLVSISNGLLISPKLEQISFYDCPSLKTLSTEEVSSNYLKVIIGEAEWWRELKLNKSEWFKPPNLDAIFVPIERDIDFITQLAEISDQLQARMQETKPSQ